MIETGVLVQTLIGAAALAGTLTLGNRGYLARGLGRERAESLAGGAAVAYVFVHFLPELARTQLELNATAQQWSFASRVVPIATMIGFIVFYGIQVLVVGAAAREAEAPSTSRMVFRAHIFAFSTYTWMVAYLFVAAASGDELSPLFYCVAMALHFLGVARALHEIHHARYDRWGARILAGCVFLGWACGLAFRLPVPVLAVLLGFVGGGVLVNTMLMELPRGPDGRLWLFVAGALVYSALLFAAGM